jgi:hypothetical protein
MNYLVIKDNVIAQLCTSVEDLLKYLEVNITDEGVVEITNDGRQLPTTYNMKEYSKNEIMQDVIKYQLKKIEGMLQIGIYKLERMLIVDKQNSELLLAMSKQRDGWKLLAEDSTRLLAQYAQKIADMEFQLAEYESLKNKEK